MTASVGIEIEMSGRGALQSEASGIVAAGRGAWARSANSSTARPAESGQSGQSGLIAASSGANRAATREPGESFQSRWESMLATIGSGSAEGEAEGPQEGLIAAAAGPGSEARSAASSLRRGAIRFDTTPGQAQPGVSSRVQSAPSGLKGSGTGPGLKSGAGLESGSTAAHVGEESGPNLSAAGTASVSTRQRDGERKRASQPGPADSAAGSVAMAGQPAALTAVIATPASAESAAALGAAPVSAQEDGQIANALSAVFTPDLQGAATGRSFAQQPGSPVHAIQAADRPGAHGESSGAIAGSASEVPEAVRRASSPAGVDDNPAGQNALGAGEAAVAPAVRVGQGREGGFGPDSGAAIQPQEVKMGERRQPAESAQAGPSVSAANRESASDLARLNQTNTDADSTQIPALAAADSGPGSRSTEPLASVRMRNSSEATPSAAQGVTVASSSGPDSSIFAHMNQTNTNADLTQIPALAAANSGLASRSTGQLASVRVRNSSDAAPSAAHGGTVASSSGPDALIFARNPEGSPGGAHVLNETPAGTAGSAPAGARETFAALDAEQAAAGAPNWIHAGAQQAEAGFQDPALGWVGVRADLSAGGIHAAVVPGSAEAAQLLGGHMAGLNAHLAAEQIPVTSLSMDAATRNGSSGLAQGAMQPDAGQAGAGQQGQGRGAEQGGTVTDAQTPRQSRDVPDAHDLPGQMQSLSATRGTHIYVVA